MRHRDAKLDQRVIVTEAKGWTLLEVGDVGVITEFSSWNTDPVARVTVKGKRDLANWIPSKHMEPYPLRETFFQRFWNWM